MLHRFKEERNIMHTVKRRKTNRICYILRRNCIIQQTIERKMEGKDEGEDVSNC